jgi:hypothetical protein
MDCITFLTVLRAVENEAAKRGYHGDLTTDVGEVPLIGTLRQQLAIATIGADVRPRPTSDDERRIVSHLVRAAVLASPVQSPITHHVASNQADAVRRAHRHAVAGRRRQQRRPL